MDIKEDVNRIIMSNTVRENILVMTEYIPEIENMKGFEHMHPHHNLDVLEHTLKVLEYLKDENDLELKMAGLLHDIGKPFSYQDEEVRHFHGHPEVSANMSEKILRNLGYDERFIKNVCYFVRTHDTIINVNNLDNNYYMIIKRLKLQYADAKSHNPKVVKKRINFLDNINKQLERIESIERIE